MSAALALRAVIARTIRLARTVIAADRCSLGIAPCEAEADIDRVRTVAQRYVDECSHRPFTWSCPHGVVLLRVEPTTTTITVAS